ncbi:Na+/H+ antiporter [Sphingomonas sp. CLY1604]|uniref:Na+/H+ antiporter n=1 Tax=Sphingomonas sp. CLY1604 TaxID=3457786 RepID=UPI003FD8188D
MDIVALCLFLLLAVVVSGIVARILPSALPRPLVQIALGALIGSFAGIRVELDPELFFLLLVPPLLFLDGWRIPKDELFRDARIVLGLALGLVFLTVLGLGLFVHWLVPAMPLAVAFALAAVVSPTDPIAVGAIAQKVAIPKRMMHILEGESLLNDASGLVCLRFAIAAALSGAFSLPHAIGTFAWTALGGVAIGAALTWAAVQGKALVARRFGDDTGSNILVSLLIPFGAYLAAEHVHASGVLAAAAAGITMTFAGSGVDTGASTRIRRRAVWDMLQFTLNGVIFVLLGEQLPELFRGARAALAGTGHDSAWWLLAYVAAIVAVLAVLRYGWVWLSLQFTLFRARRRGHEGAGSPPRRVIAAMSVAGARGAITLAGALTLPLAMPDGAPFPARDLLILLASGVILASLVIAAVGLPILLRDLSLPPEEGATTARDQARTITAKAAITAIERAQHALCEADDADRYTDVAARLMAQYRERIEDVTGDQAQRDEQARDRAIERALRLAGIRAERQALFDLAQRREISVTLAEQLGRELDLADARLTRLGMR